MLLLFKVNNINVSINCCVRKIPTVTFTFNYFITNYDLFVFQNSQRSKFSRKCSYTEYRYDGLLLSGYVQIVSDIIFLKYSTSGWTSNRSFCLILSFFVSDNLFSDYRWLHAVLMYTKLQYQKQNNYIVSNSREISRRKI